MKFNKKELQEKFKNFDYKKEWGKIQEESPKIANGIRVLTFILVGMLVLRSFNSCNSNKPTTVKETTVIADTVNTSGQTESKVVEYDTSVVKPKVKQEYKRPENAHNVFVFNEQIKYLYTLPQLKDVPVEDIRKAYFKAQNVWFEKYILKTEDGELVNFKKYLGDE